MAAEFDGIAVTMNNKEAWEIAFEHMQAITPVMDDDSLSKDAKVEGIYKIVEAYSFEKKVLVMMALEKIRKSADNQSKAIALQARISHPAEFMHMVLKTVDHLAEKQDDAIFKATKAPLVN